MSFSIQDHNIEKSQNKLSELSIIFFGGLKNVCVLTLMKIVVAYFNNDIHIKKIGRHYIQSPMIKSLQP